jgi:ABC-type multidrug transport system ATPase subunit
VILKNLTVEENLIFFLSFMGVQKAFLKDTVEKTLAEVNLAHMRSNLATDLSGG